MGQSGKIRLHSLYAGIGNTPQEQENSAYRIGKHLNRSGMVCAKISYWIFREERIL